MRFSILTSNLVFVLLLTIVGLTTAKSIKYENTLLTREAIEVEMISNYLEKRQHQGADSTATTTATTATNGTATDSSKASATTTAAAKKKAATSSFASPAILQDGTLFYIATAVTCLLWTTGKFIDVKMERQERYAESLIHSI